MCAAITIQTFSVRHLIKRLKDRWSDLPKTGFKVSVAKGRVLVKLVGTRYRIAEQEAIWAGKPVNYAAKCAQSATRHNIIVTTDVWDDIRGNDYLEFSCGCHGDAGPDGLLELTGAPMNEIWSHEVVERPPDDEQNCRRVSSTWCVRHGETFRAPILRGEPVNPKADELRKEVGAPRRAAAAEGTPRTRPAQPQERDAKPIEAAVSCSLQGWSAAVYGHVVRNEPFSRNAAIFAAPEKDAEWEVGRLLGDCSEQCFRVCVKSVGALGGIPSHRGPSVD